MPVIEFRCPFCNATVKAPDQVAGKAARCPKCRKKCVVPDPVSEPSPFDFHQLSAPGPMVGNENLTMAGLEKKINMGRWPLALPLWGIFGILLVVFLSAAGYGGWKIWDRYCRQPRLSAMFNHYREWQSWQSAEEDDVAFIHRLETNLAEAKKYSLRDKVKHSRSALDRLDRYCKRWEAELVEARGRRLEDRQKRLALENDSLSEFGIPVTELHNAMDDFLHSIADDQEAIVRFRLLVEEDLRRRPRPILQWLPFRTPIDLSSWETVLSEVEALQRIDEQMEALQRMEEQSKRALREFEEEYKGDATDPLTTPEERRAAEADKERKRKATEEEALRQHQKQLELDRKREADRQRQMKIDEQEKKARKLLRPALQLNVRGGFHKQVRERLQEIIDNYPGTPSAKEAQRQLDKMTK